MRTLPPHLHFLVLIWPCVQVDFLFHLRFDPLLLAPLCSLGSRWSVVEQCILLMNGQKWIAPHILVHSF